MTVAALTSEAFAGSNSPGSLVKYVMKTFAVAAGLYDKEVKSKAPTMTNITIAVKIILFLMFLNFLIYKMRTDLA